MRDHLAPKDPAEVDLKHSPGGLVDIEFLVQYLTLANAAQVPALRSWPDNIRLLEVMANAGVMTVAEAEALTAAYLSLRAKGHRMALADMGRQLPSDMLALDMSSVKQIWSHYLENSVVAGT